MLERLPGAEDARAELSKKMSVLVFCGCCNKLPQTWLFKTKELYSHTVPEARIRNQDVGRVALPPKAPTASFLASFSLQWRQALTNLWQKNSCLCPGHHMASSWVFSLLFVSSPFLMRTLDTRFLSSTQSIQDP